MNGMTTIGFGRAWHSCAGIAFLAGTVVFLAGCPSSGPKSIDVDLGPRGTYHWDRDGNPVSSPPPGWTPDGGQTICIPLQGGGCVNVYVCVAHNTSDPNCIYAKVGPCSTPGTWQKYCKEIANDSPFDEPEPCSVSGTIEIDGGTVTATLDLCRELTLDASLVGTLVWDESEEEFITASQWIGLYGATVEEGTTIMITGAGAGVAWDSYLLGFVDFAFEDGNDVYKGGVALTAEGLPIAAVVLNGNVVDKRVVCRPD